MSTESLDQSVLPVKFTGRSGREANGAPVPSSLSGLSSLDDICIFARAKTASDIHIMPQMPITFRQSGKLVKAAGDPLTAEQIEIMLKNALPADIMTNFMASGDTEYVHVIAGHGRYRMTVMKQRDGYKVTARVIPKDVMKFEATGMPPSCAGLTKWAQGLVLITGPAGCGKTTTLAALVELINQSQADHIVTIEHPIEIVYEPRLSQITQREILVHTLSQDNALRAALREDPDILVVSELRDLQTIQLAITAAETGHLVFGTMNTVNAAQSISRIVDSFPAEEQSNIRNMVSESLRGVISQQLIPKKDGSGMVPAYEVLIVNSSTANMIREGKIGQINNAITTGKAAGMVLLDTSLEALVLNGTISKAEALERATNPAAMIQALQAHG